MQYWYRYIHLRYRGYVRKWSRRMKYVFKRHLFDVMVVQKCTHISYVDGSQQNVYSFVGILLQNFTFYSYEYLLYYIFEGKSGLKIKNY